MRSLFLLSFVFLFCIIGQAQLTTAIGKYHYEFSAPPISLSDGTSIEAHVKHHFASGANWNKLRQYITLRKWDDNNTIVKEVKLMNGEPVFSGFFSELKQIGKKFWLFYVTVASGNSIGSLMAMEVNPETLETGTPKTIITTQELDITIRLVGGGNYYFQIKGSPDQKSVGVFIASDRGDFSLTSLNENMDRLWSRKASIKGVETSEIESVATDNQGRIYLAYMKKDRAQLLRFGKSDNPTEITVDLGSSKPKDIILLSGKKGITIAGAYYEGSGYCTGIYKTTVLPERASVSSITKIVFPADFISSLAIQNWASTKNGKSGIAPSFKFSFIELEDGTPDLTAEFRYINDVRSAVTHCGPIMNIALDESKPVFSVIPKNGIVAGAIYINQFATLIKGKQLVFYYYDNPENLERASSQKAAIIKQKKSVMVAANLEEDGTLNRKIVSGVYQ